MSAPQIPESLLRCPCPRCCFLACAATAAPHTWLFLTLNCSRVSIYIIGTCVRAARASWTLLWPCQHLRYRNLYSDAHVPDAAFWPEPPLLPHICGCFSHLTALVCPYTSLGRVYVSRAQVGRYHGHVGTSDTEICAQMPMSQMLLFGPCRHCCPTYLVVSHA